MKFKKGNFLFLQIAYVCILVSAMLIFHTFSKITCTLHKGQRITPSYLSYLACASTAVFHVLGWLTFDLFLFFLNTVVVEQRN